MIWLKDKRLILVCGTGGVGKTSLAAAIALRQAELGKRVCLVTIDPARRLAQALGLRELGGRAVSLDKHIAKSLKINKLAGSLSALMLESESTLYDFLRKLGGEDLSESFRRNRLFKIIAGNFSGTHDYLAMEKLYELHFEENFECIVLDTPPARHTLDFLHAPDRIARFFDDRIFLFFLREARSDAFTEKLRARSADAALSILERITGNSVLQDFVELAPHIYKIKNAFVERQRQIQKLLRSDDSGIIFVSSPTDLARGEVEPFLLDAKQYNIQVLAFFLNRSLQRLCPISAAEAKKRDDLATPALREYLELRSLVDQEKKNLASLQKLSGDCSVVIIPEMQDDIGIRELYAMAQNF